MDLLSPGSGVCHRRTFITGTLGALALLALPSPGRGFVRPEVRKGFVSPHPALFARSLPDKQVKCLLCPRGCEVGDGERGDCGVRENRGGTYYTLAYANPCAVHVDPVEKKPFFHVLPGSASFSIATAGCNLHCRFCQNWEISQARPEETFNYHLTPEQVVAGARETGCASIAHTYVEPVIFYEYMVAVGRLAKAAGILNVMHSNGYINPEPLERLTEVLDAACIDLKSFDNRFYQEMTDGELAPVLDTLKTLRRRGVHVEIVTLLIPEKNDDPDGLRALCTFIRDELGPLTPVHFSRFYPLHKMMNHYPTPVSTLERARDLAREVGLKYVYLGNLPGHEAENTTCHACGRLVIARRGYRLGEMHLHNGACGHCGQALPGLWGRLGGGGGRTGGT
jgi:pyruvate formate lyase activating enzyme